MLFNNSRVRRRLAVRNPITMKIALPLDDHRKLEAFVALLAQIDKRNRANGKETKSRDPTKAKDALLGQYRKGSQKCGSFFFKQLLYSLIKIVIRLNIFFKGINMKIILISLFVISNAIGMQPQSKKDCYLAHTEFKALARTCKQKERKRNYGGEFSKELYPDEYARKVCVVHYYHNFLDECRKEAALKNQ